MINKCIIKAKAEKNKEGDKSVIMFTNLEDLSKIKASFISQIKKLFWLSGFNCNTSSKTIIKFVIVNVIRKVAKRLFMF